MDAMVEMLYEELRQTEQEIITYLQAGPKDDWLAAILKEELADIQIALGKMASGNYGKCEISGEFLPKEILTTVPTIKSVNDYKNLAHFYRKSIHLHHGLSFR